MILKEPQSDPKESWDLLQMIDLEKQTPQAVAKLSDVEYKSSFDHAEVSSVILADSTFPPSPGENNI